MPLVVSSYAWDGIPGLQVAAPRIEYFNAAWSEKIVEQMWNWVVLEDRERVALWAHDLAVKSHKRPWWLLF